MRFHILNTFDKFYVSTALILDRTDKPYETAIIIKGKENDFDGIKVFEIYDGELEARQGHLRWLEKAKSFTIEEFNEHKDLVQNYMVSLEQQIQWGPQM